MPGLHWKYGDIRGLSPIREMAPVELIITPIVRVPGL